MFPETWLNSHIVVYIEQFKDSLAYFLKDCWGNYFWAWHSHFEFWLVLHIFLIIWWMMRRTE